MKRFAMCSAVALLSLIAPQSRAYSVKDLPLSEKVSASDAVLIGHVVGLKNASSSYNKFAIVRIRTVLKGGLPNVIEILANGPFDEAVPDCCKVGHNYLFFVRHIKGITYHLVDQGYGIYSAE